MLERQTRRMLADPKARALVTNFAGQWLFLRELKNANPDVTIFPDFDDNLRQAFQRETELLFESVMREDRTVLDLLDADYTFVNERLARHYGIPNIYGPDFRRVPVPNDARRGLLGHGSLLLVTSNPNRTSPVMRGKWILENLLGTPAPLPPPDVPPLEEKPTATAKSVRERIEQHRASPACAGCHKIMDPIGLALENFDAVGRWRTADEGVAIDASAQLVDGTPIDGPASLRKALLDRPDAFVAVDDREAADVRRRPRDEVLRHAGRAHRDARRGEEPISVLGSGPRHRQERAVSDESEIVVRTEASRPDDRSNHVVHHEEAPAAPHVPARHGRHAGAAAARLDDSGGHAAGQDRGAAEEPLLRHLHPARRDDGQVDAGDGRQRLRLHRDAASRSRSSATASSWSATWRTRWPAARARTPAPITRARRRCS